MDLYEAVYRRRDVRAEFSGAPLPDGALERVLNAANAAPSVGMSQPWDFIVVSDSDLKRRFHTHVDEERREYASQLDAEQREKFQRIKIDGILESTLSVVVTYNADRGGPNVLGRHAIADAGLYSVCLAIENLWLAATAEELGMGWVSFYREHFLSQLLGIPDGIRPIAWLCLGPVTRLQETPDLERHRWRKRRPLEDSLHRNGW
ncbi:5,6-dimethylbenzimidazole synthase [Haloglycomyces albus]|uniref:5,6-dimethylbenzimidazole synthase n=1 Tax=Haloglycomyces albus TaxID=526067 RepID=UPI0004A35795|nr:5,6-dimethylbenzimidazole synthase [Haloglycomyces albus]